MKRGLVKKTPGEKPSKNLRLRARPYQRRLVYKKRRLVNLKLRGAVLPEAPCN